MQANVIESLPLEKPAINPWTIAGVVMLATFMEVLDTSVANVALPHIAGSLASSTDEATWVLTAYLVANAIVLPLSGWFSTLFGRKRFYMTCVAIFTISSTMCGLAPNLGTLILFRILQGLGGGALQPVSQAILRETFPREKQGMAMAVYGMGVVLAPVVGPTLGGWITDNFTWRWIFLINIPVGICSLLFTSLLIFDPPYLKRKSLAQGLKIDYIGLGLLATGLAALEITLDEGQRHDWFSSGGIVAAAIVGVTCLVSVVLWELRQKDPVVDFRLLKDRNFLVFFIASILICVPLAFYYQYANLFLTEIHLANATGKQTLGQMSEVLFMLLIPLFLMRVGMKGTLLVGMLAWAVRYVLFAYGNPGHLVWMLLVGIALHGVCYDFFFVSGQIYTDSKAGERCKSAAQGMITLATYGVGMLVGFWAAGQIASHYADHGALDWTAIWLFPALFAIVVFLLFMAMFRNERTAYGGAAQHQP